MDVVLRTIAIIIEVIILVGIVYVVFNGARLAALDLGIKAKYNKVIIMAFLAVAAIVIVFFIAHLATFYPVI